MKYLLIFFTITFHGQVLHRQMLSSQGMTKVLSNGSVVTQSIGQQSLIDLSGNKFVVMHGFQQSIWGKYISTTIIDEIKTTTFPNPFIDTINFQLSKTIAEVVNVNIFDISGRLVFFKNIKSNNTLLTIDLSSLPSSEYLVRLNSTNFRYYTKIIKL